MSFVRLDVGETPEKVIEAKFASMYLNPIKIEVDDTFLTLKVEGDQFPVFVCVNLPDKVEISTPIVAIVSDIAIKDGKEIVLGSQMHYTDDKRRCFSTSGIWQREKDFTRVDFGGDSTDEKGTPLKKITISIEVNLGETLARAISSLKWDILALAISLLTCKLATVKILESVDFSTRTSQLIISLTLSMAPLFVLSYSKSDLKPFELIPIIVTGVCLYKVIYLIIEILSAKVKAGFTLKLFG